MARGMASTTALARGVAMALARGMAMALARGVARGMARGVARCVALALARGVARGTWCLHHRHAERARQSLHRHLLRDTSSASGHADAPRSLPPSRFVHSSIAPGLLSRSARCAGGSSAAAICSRAANARASSV